jgi:hypothetical protein
MDSSKSFSRQTSFGSDQVILYHEALSPRSDFGQLEKLLTNLDEKEKESLKDLKKYLLQKEGAWLLDLQMLDFVSGLLEHRSLNPDIRVKMLRLLAAGASRQDFSSPLQMDRKNRSLMKFANLFDELSVEEQKGVALFLCNAFSSGKGSEWVMYGSTWMLNDDTETSNVRIASKVAGYSMVSYTPSLQEYGSALIYNIAFKETKALLVPKNKYTEEDLPSAQLDYSSVTNEDIMNSSDSSATKFVTLKVYNDVAAELSMAILKYIKKTKSPPEEILYRCVRSLVKFSHVIPTDLLSCIAMVQVDLDDLVKGHSDRIDTEMSTLRSKLVSAKE